MAKPTYHLHMDAAHLPAPLMDRMIQEGGFHLDDFPHSLEVNGQKVEARHLTKYLYAPINSQSAKAECLKLKSWADEFSFKGLIQCEYVMEESEWNYVGSFQNKILPPFKITSRPLSKKKGDSFKKHEIHLEINKLFSSSEVVNALRECGLHILENDNTITFTTSGHSKEMLTIRKALKEFLAQHGENITAKLTYEATAFWSLHDVEPETLPLIVDQVMLPQ